jgi:hypothetical protein
MAGGGAIVADPLQPDSLKLYPNGLGIQRFIGPFEGPEGRPWYVGGRAAANNRVSLGGFDDSHARLHGFDPDSGVYDLPAISRLQDRHVRAGTRQPLGGGCCVLGV